MTVVIRGKMEEWENREKGEGNRENPYTYKNVLCKILMLIIDAEQ